MYKGSSTKKRAVAFNWGPKQEDIFQVVKAVVAINALSSSDPKVQYHLSTNISTTGLGRILFQIRDYLADTILSTKTILFEKIIIFMLFALTPTESQYYITEQEVLAVIQYLEEVHQLVAGSKHKIILYTNYMAIKSILEDSGNPKGQVIWQQY